MKICVIEDDETINTMLTQYLTAEGFAVEAAVDGTGGLDLLLTHEFDVAVVDVMLPNMNGFDVVKALRAKKDTPVIMLTARTEEIDRILGLEIGADDYMTKPFSARELVARIKALQRRIDYTRSAGCNNAIDLNIGPICIHPKRREVEKHGEVVDLTATEFSLLMCLVEHRGEVVSKENLSRIALGRRLVAFDRSIDMHMSNLRKKLDNDPQIKTVRGTGYVLIDE